MLSRAADVVERVQAETCRDCHRTAQDGRHIVPPQGFLRDVNRSRKSPAAPYRRDDHGIRRTGRMLGCDSDTVVPDIMTLARMHPVFP